MKKKIITALLLGTALSLSACSGSFDSPDETKDSAQTDSSANNSVETENAENNAVPNSNSDTEGSEEKNAGTSTEVNESEQTVGQNDENAVVVNVTPTNVSVSYKEESKEINADDGTQLLYGTIQTPAVQIEGTETVAGKINANLMETGYFSATVSPEMMEWVTDDYEISKGDDQYPFTAYSEDVYVKTPRMDDSVLSFEVTIYSYTGGAHGNYGSIGLNYNTKTGEAIAFDELADDPAAFRAAALAYLNELTETPAYKDRMFPSDDPFFATDIEEVLFAENKWFFSDSGLVFISDPYALGSYASGTIYFTIPYDKAAGMGLKDEYAYDGNYTLARYYTSTFNEETMTQVMPDGEAEYDFDLNGDGAADGIAFYGSVSLPAAESDQPESGQSNIVIYINGVELGAAMNEQIDLQTGYLDSGYVLYDLNPDDSYVEIGVPFTTINETQTGNPDHTYFFRYTQSGELIYLGEIEGNAATSADIDFAGGGL